MKTYYAYKNIDFVGSTTFKNSNDVAIDVTGHTSTLAIVKYYDSETPVEVSGTISGTPINGTFSYTVPIADLQSLNGANVYTIVLKNSLGVVVSVQNGQFIVIPTVAPKPIIPSVEE